MWYPQVLLSLKCQYRYDVSDIYRVFRLVCLNRDIKTKSSLLHHDETRLYRSCYVDTLGTGSLNSAPLCGIVGTGIASRRFRRFFRFDKSRNHSILLVEYGRPRRSRVAGIYFLGRASAGKSVSLGLSSAQSASRQGILRQRLGLQRRTVERQMARLLVSSSRVESNRIH
jgi:hypothetical protein